jgi:hypothetical protein
LNVELVAFSSEHPFLPAFARLSRLKSHLVRARGIGQNIDFLLRSVDSILGILVASEDEAIVTKIARANYGAQVHL